MSTYIVKEKHASRSSSGDSAQIVYYVKTPVRQGPLLVMSAPGLPRRGDAYQEPGYTDKNLWAQWPPNTRQLSRLWWEVAFQYRAVNPNGAHMEQQQEEDPSPLAEAPSWSDRSEKTIFYPPADIDGNPFVNSAKYPLDAIGIPWSIGVITVRRNVAWFDRNRAETYRNTINSSEFAGFPAETVCCWEVSGEGATRGKWNYAVETWEFRVNKYKHKGKYVGWKHVVIDRGPYFIKQNEGGVKEMVPFTDRDKRAIHGLFPLDGSGNILSQARRDEADFEWLTFNVRQKLDFNALRLGAKKK